MGEGRTSFWKGSRSSNRDNRHGMGEGEASIWKGSRAWMQMLFMYGSWSSAPKGTSELPGNSPWCLLARRGHSSSSYDESWLINLHSATLSSKIPPLWTFSRSAKQFLPQSNSIPAPSHSTNPGAKASSAFTPPATLMQAPPDMRDNLTKTTGVPPPLPPSVEEAYRRKCIQLKQRMNEVEEANDASRQRLARLNRQIQKMRLERAFLLEQLAKRTSTNVEDSEGSPSPPPTVCTSLPHPNRLLSTVHYYAY
jgi:hypothetical protein